MSEIQLGVDLKRLVFGLSHSGYTPAAALFDIVDNAVQAVERARFAGLNSGHVWVHVRKANPSASDNRRNNVSAYEIVDDGSGMDAEGIAAALSLAANDPAAYGASSLSKFGLGLKAAAFSQGSELQVISSPGGGIPFVKRVVAFDQVRPDAYFATAEPLSDDDQALIEAHLPEGRGTVVRIARVHVTGHPSVRETLAEMRRKAGIVYYYFLRDGLMLTLRDHEVVAFDPLFAEEAESNGPLDEHDWDGRSVRWIQVPKRLVLDVEQGVTAQLEVTQLPHPPTFALGDEDQQDETRKRYNIWTGNYGYYVYRNKRLIAWAEGFDGIVPQDQDLYSFRGRLLIDESADEAFNIDLKKAHLVLSDEARTTLEDVSKAFRAKSRKAWNHAKALVSRRRSKEPNKQANLLAEEFDPPVLPAEALATPDESAEQQRREAAVRAENETQIHAEAVRALVTTGEVTAGTAPTPEQVAAVVRGNANPKASHVFRVAQVQDNLLWEPYFDAEYGWGVRINALHRFGVVVFEDNAENPDLQVLFELMLLTLAQAEVATRTVSKVADKDVALVLAQHRKNVSEYLAKLCLDLGDRLPPLSD